MDFFKIIITSISSAAALFLMTRLIGNKQMSQLNLFDYINGITIGSIAAELAITSEKDFWKPLLALVIYALITFFINLAASKSIKMRRFLEGKSIILMEKGRIFPEGFKKARIDINEFLTMCRIAGYFDISSIDTAIIEPNGEISFLPVENERPVTLKDMNLSPKQSNIMFTVIADGKILPENLRLTGYDKNYLNEQLKKQKLSVKDVFLGISGGDGTFTFFRYDSPRHMSDPFQ
jgi:uncharacterized membrane protein YcaP (DUF421 family)